MGDASEQLAAWQPCLLAQHGGGVERWEFVVERWVVMVERWVVMVERWEVGLERWVGGEVS